MLLETRKIPKTVKYLLIINISVYIFTLLTGLHSKSILLFGLIPQAILHHFQIWRLFTYLFLHAGPLHIIFNMFVLWMFGPEIERRMGRGQFLFYYLFTGAGGGLFPLIFGGPYVPIVGASTSIFGLLVAFGIMFPNTIISLIIPPVSMKAKHFVIVIAVIAFIFFLGGGGSVAWSAHLGGMLFAYCYFRYGVMRHKKWMLTEKIKKYKDKFDRIRKQEQKQFIEQELDPILDKISKVGMKGLTKRERQILKKAKYRIQR